MSEPRAFAPLAQRASCQLGLILVAAQLACLVGSSLLPLAFAGPLGLGLLVRRLHAFGSARSVLPNMITALRVLLISMMGLLGAGADPRLQAALVALVFTLDGVDGTLARRLGASSPLGAHFDMESDGYLVLSLCALLFARGHAPWVLSGGLLRYAYVFVTSVVPSRGEAPPSRFGRYAFSIALTSLSAALLLKGWGGVACAALGTGVLLTSFGRSFYWALRPRALEAGQLR